MAQRKSGESVRGLSSLFDCVFLLTFAAATFHEIWLAYIAAPFFLISCGLFMAFVFLGGMGRFLYDHVMDEPMRARFRNNKMFKYFLEIE